MGIPASVGQQMTSKHSLLRIPGMTLEVPSTSRTPGGTIVLLFMEKLVLEHFKDLMDSCRINHLLN